ncbi:MAG: hypothetical protein ACTSW1_09570 [Candidatus Hodarchaeales archaeon]
MMITRDLKLDPILQLANQALRETQDPKAKTNLRKWISWVEKQKEKFDKGLIIAYQYFMSVRGFAIFLKSELQLENEAIDNTISNNYCQVCLAELSQQDLEKGACPNCRMPLSKTRKIMDGFFVPKSRDGLNSIKYSLQTYFKPARTFSYFKFGIESWTFFIATFIVTSIIIGMFVVITLPRINYGNPVKQMEWSVMANSVLTGALSGYIILESLGFLFYSGLFYAISKGSHIKLSFTEIFRISSVIIAPRMIVIPLIALLNQLTSNETYILDYNVSYNQAKYLIFNITDFSGKLGIIVEFISFIIIIILVYYALEYLWDFHDGIWLRITPLIFIALVFTFGIPFFI